MNADIESKRVAMAMRYQRSLRHTIQVDYIDYMDQLSTLNGCKPNLGRHYLNANSLKLIQNTCNTDSSFNVQMR